MTARAGAVAAGLGLACLALAALGGATLTTLLQAWVFAAHEVTGLSLGAAVLLLIHAITGGRWGEALRPYLAGMALVMPLAALLWVPLILTAGGLFPWATTPVDQLPQTVVKKLAYLDVGFLQVRTVVVLALFVGIAWIAAGSRRVPGLGLSAAALSVYGIAVSVLAIDWLLAFEPEFYSTAYPVIHATGGVVAALAFATLGLAAAGGRPERLEDCGMLLLGWAMVWLYLVFMQYLIIWSGDLPNEIHWYLVRVGGGWTLPLLLALACHIGAVAAMSSPRLKLHPRAVSAAAAALLVGQAADLWWRTAPAFAPAVSARHLVDAAALLAAGGLWALAATLGSRRRREAAHV